MTDSAAQDGAVDGAIDGAARDAGLDRQLTDGTPAPDGTPVSGGLLVLPVTGRTLQLTVLGPRTVRVRYLNPAAKAAPQRGWTTRPLSWPNSPLATVDQGDTLVHRTAALEIRISKQDASVSFHELSGAAILETISPTGAGYSRTLRQRITANDHFYGLGEKTGPLDKRGQLLQMWNTDPLYPTANYTPTSDPIYQSHPFVLGLRGGRAYGLYLLSTFKSQFDLGQSDPTELRATTDGGELDYVFFAGPAVSRVVQDYTDLVGRAPLPPRWTLGYHQSRWSYYPEAQVRQITAELRSRQIPCDGFWLDIHYMDGYRSFTWDKTRFPDPWQLLADLDQTGFKVTAIIDPGIKADPGSTYKVYNDGVAQGHFVTMPDGSLVQGPVWPGPAVFPDFTRPQTRAWWSGLVQSFVGTGLRGIWIDMNEPAVWLLEGFPLDSVFDGEGHATDHRETHNVYALLMAQATRQGMLQARPNERPFVLTRAGFAGIQRHAAVWTGDMESSWDHLAMAPAMLMNLSLSGVPQVGTDVGGFSGSPSPELYARWIQLGAISPFFRTHVQQSAPPQEPWSFGTEVEQISRQLIELRYRLLPYLYDLMWQASESGAPPLRPLFYEFAADPETYGLSHQLLLGPYLMAAPVVNAGRGARAAYLPAGTWFDYWSGAAFSGAETVSVAAPLSRLPLLVRQGAILPSTELMQYVGQKQPQLLTLDLYPVNGAPPTEHTLYQDDGVSLDHQKGVSRRRRLALTTDAGGATLLLDAPVGSYAPPETQLALRVHGVVAPPSQITVDGTPLPARSALSELETKPGWVHDAAARTAHVRLPLPAGKAQLRCHYDATLPLWQRVKVTVDATLPAGTPAGPIYLASNLGGWEPDSHPMQRSGNQASVTLDLQQGMHLEYKITRGSWSTVERGPGCAALKNRQLPVADAGSGAQSVPVTVASWADQCRK